MKIFAVDSSPAVKLAQSCAAKASFPTARPLLGETLDTDLSEYGFSLLRASLTLREQQASANDWRSGFLRAGNAFEALVRNGSPGTLQRGLWRVMGAASYHLAGYSAMAYSLISQREENANFAPGELALARLILRDLRTLRNEARTWILDPAHHDATVRATLSEGAADFDDAISAILTTTIYRALAVFEFALATGSAALHEEVADAVIAKMLIVYVRKDRIMC